MWDSISIQNNGSRRLDQNLVGEGQLWYNSAALLVMRFFVWHRGGIECDPLP